MNRGHLLFLFAPLVIYLLGQGHVLSVSLVVGVLVVIALLTRFWSPMANLAEAARVRNHQRKLRPCLGFPGLEEGRFEGRRIRGRFAGYELELSLSTRVRGDERFETLVYALQLPGRAYSQELSLMSLRESADSEGAQAAGVRAALAHLGKIPDLELYVAEGWIELERAVTSYAKGDTSLSSAFRALSELVPLFARVELDLQLRPRESGAPNVQADAQADSGLTLAWSEKGSGQPLCPYCRDDLDQSDLELSRCATCHTLHHSECLEELGRCSVFGCSGEGRQRIQARA